MREKSILLVDDDFNEVINFQKYLTELNLHHTLVTANSDAKALEILCDPDTKNNPEILLVNLESEKVNASAFVRLVRNYYSLRHVKIFLIGNPENSALNNKELDITAFLKKPLSFSSIADSGTLSGYNLLLNELMK